MSLLGVNGSPISISNEAIARAAQFPTVQSKIEFIRFLKLCVNFLLGRLNLRQP